MRMSGEYCLSDAEKSPDHPARGTSSNGGGTKIASRSVPPDGSIQFCVRRSAVDIAAHSLHPKSLLGVEDRATISRPDLARLSDIGADVVSSLALKKGNLQAASRPESLDQAVAAWTSS